LYAGVDGTREVKEERSEAEWREDDEAPGGWNEKGGGRVVSAKSYGDETDDGGLDR
jgi:hypothetical protein